MYTCVVPRVQTSQTSTTRTASGCIRTCWMLDTFEHPLFAWQVPPMACCQPTSTRHVSSSAGNTTQQQQPHMMLVHEHYNNPVSPEQPCRKSGSRHGQTVLGAGPAGCRLTPLKRASRLVPVELSIKQAAAAAGPTTAATAAAAAGCC